MQLDCSAISSSMTSFLLHANSLFKKPFKRFSLFPHKSWWQWRVFSACFLKLTFDTFLLWTNTWLRKGIIKFLGNKAWFYCWITFLCKKVTWRKSLKTCLTRLFKKKFKEYATDQSRFLTYVPLLSKGLCASYIPKSWVICCLRILLWYTRENTVRNAGFTQNL